jgi:hypothetical protein
VITMQSTCISPQGEVFDGAHIWVACSGSNELEEYNASDTTFMRKVSLASSPNYLLYDGKNIWALNSAVNTITEVQASSGTVLGIVTVGTNPAAMAFDGQYIWVTNTGSSTLSQVNPLTRTVVNTVNISGTAYQDCTGPTSIAYSSAPAFNNQNTSLWVVCTASPGPVQLMELTSTGGFVGATAFNAIGGSPNCNNIAFDGRYIWLPTSSGPTAPFSEVLQIDTTTLSLTTTVSLNSDPVSVAYDGKYIWVARSDGSVSKILQSTGVLFATAPAAGGPAYFIAFDGGYAWVSTPNSSNNVYTISKM